MAGAGSLADRSDGAGRRVLDASRAVEAEARTLGAELEAFLLAMRDTQERRKYERLDGGGARAEVQAEGRRTEARIIDISRGGASLAGAFSGWPTGISAHVALPGASEPVAARLIRLGADSAGFAFRQDPASLAQIDRALEAITRRAA
jgi:hypothetical protein